ncbi:MAG: hypothetical protein K2Y37_12215 [Pirellulales bacterium]|nr:hypothetical protein [Pirellulales bacterium]
MPTRRDLLRAGTLACGGALLGATDPARLCGEETPAKSSADTSDARCLDFGLSFICGTAAFNAVRFWIESRTTIVDERAGTTAVYYQCASCKSENTFAPKNLFPADNYDFLPILGDGRWLIFRRHAYLNADYRQVRTVEDSWGPTVTKLHYSKALSELTTWEAIRDATAAGWPIVSQTKLRNDELSLQATIECPVKTMNVSLKDRLFQVDTGPVALPDLSKRYDEPLDALRLAFVAFNAPDFADFVVEQPTPVVEGGAEKCRIYHYSSPISLPARNVLLALEI